VLGASRPCVKLTQLRIVAFIVMRSMQMRAANVLCYKAERMAKNLIANNDRWIAVFTSVPDKFF
jgi:hypothetical protein